MPTFFRVVGTGSREWQDAKALFRVLDALIEAKGYVFLAQGGARGADKMMVQWCMHARTKYGISRIKMKTYTAKWKTPSGAFDRSAGFDRNRRMVDEVKPELVLAFIQDNSGGSTQCAQYAIDSGFDAFIFRNDAEPEHIEGGASVALPKAR